MELDLGNELLKYVPCWVEKDGGEIPRQHGQHSVPFSSKSKQFTAHQLFILFYEKPDAETEPNIKWAASSLYSTPLVGISYTIPLCIPTDMEFISGRKGARLRRNNVLAIRTKLDFSLRIQGVMDARTRELVKKGPGVRLPDEGKQIGMSPWCFDRDG